MSAVSPARAAARAARASAEAHKHKKKCARDARVATKQAQAAAIAAAFARARAPRHERLRSALGGAFDASALTGDLLPYASALSMLWHTPPLSYRSTVELLCAIEARAPGLSLVPVGRRDMLGFALCRLVALGDRFVRAVTSWEPPGRASART